MGISYMQRSYKHVKESISQHCNIIAIEDIAYASCDIDKGSRGSAMYIYPYNKIPR